MNIENCIAFLFVVNFLLLLMILVYPFHRSANENINVFKNLRNHKYINALKLCAIRLKNFLLAHFRSIILIYSVWLLSPWSSMQKDLAGIGALFGGTAALLGVSLVSNYWKEQRQLAATEILSLLREFVNKTNEIILQPSLYQYEGYYPFNIPEQQSKEQMSRDWTRPIRLISNDIGTLKLALNKPLSKLVGKEYSQILELIERLENKCKIITGWLQAELGNHPDKQSIIQQYDSDKYPEMLKSFLKEAEKLLFPVITDN